MKMSRDVFVGRKEKGNKKAKSQVQVVPKLHKENP
jgi:hypothetical protein